MVSEINIAVDVLSTQCFDAIEYVYYTVIEEQSNHNFNLFGITYCHFDLQILKYIPVRVRTIHKELNQTDYVILCCLELGLVSCQIYRIAK